MSLRPLANRVLIRPIYPDKAPDALIDLAEDPPVIGDVVAIGPIRCPSCGEPLPAELEIGARVVMRPTYYQEITVNGETLWMVDLAHVLARVEAHG